MILFNGAAGGMGRFMAPALQAAGLDFSMIRSRLNDLPGLRTELNTCVSPSGPVRGWTFIPFAALVSVPYCESHPDEAFKTNVMDTMATLSAGVDIARQKGARPRILYVSTGHVYDRGEPGRLLTEEDAVKPRSVYAWTKLEAERAVRDFSDAHGVESLIVRVFGLLSPQQAQNYVLPGLIRRVRESDFSAVPGLSYERDYLDARDVCSHLAYVAGLDWSRFRFPVLNICSGEGTPIRELLMRVVKLSGLDPAWVQSRLSEAPGRPDDLPWMVGNPSRLAGLLARAPRLTPIDQTLKDAMEASDPAIRK